MLCLPFLRSLKMGKFSTIKLELHYILTGIKVKRQLCSKYSYISFRHNRFNNENTSSNMSNSNFQTKIITSWRKKKTAAMWKTNLLQTDGHCVAMWLPQNSVILWMRLVVLTSQRRKTENTDQPSDIKLVPTSPALMGRTACPKKPSFSLLTTFHGLKPGRLAAVVSSLFGQGFVCLCVFVHAWQGNLKFVV